MTDRIRHARRHGGLSQAALAELVGVHRSAVSHLEAVHPKRPNIGHLLGNLVFLLIFGLPAERVMGAGRFLVLFLLGGAVANLAAVLLIGGPDRLVIGASGAVSAVIGAYLALFPNAKLGVVLPLGLFLQFIRTPAPLLIGIWALLQVVFAYIGPAFGAVAWAAHIAGFAFGVVFALAVRAGVARRLRKQRGF